jgi:hypothetical protein
VRGNRRIEHPAHLAATGLVTNMQRFTIVQAKLIASSPYLLWITSRITWNRILNLSGPMMRLLSASGFSSLKIYIYTMVNKILSGKSEDYDQYDADVAEEYAAYEALGIPSTLSRRSRSRDSSRVAPHDRWIQLSDKIIIEEQTQH